MKRFFITSLLVLSLIGSGCLVPLLADGPQLTIRYEENAQFELIGSEGQRVLLDVAHPEALSAPPTKSDILMTTHAHDDHFNPDFVANFPGPQIFSCVGEIKQNGVYARSIPSAHMPSDPLREKGSTNYILIVDIAGLRIAHFGGIGQEKLTPEQLDALGHVDVALMQLANTFSDMDDFNRKAFNLMDQVHPRIVIPTHFDLNTAKLGAKIWPTYYWDQPSLTITPGKLPAKTQMIFMGQQAKIYGKICKVSKAAF